MPAKLSANLALFLLALPLLLCALGAWEVWRGSGQSASYRAGAADLQAKVEEVRRLAARPRPSTLRIEGDPQAYTPAGLLALIEPGPVVLRRNAVAAGLRLPFGYVTLLAGMAALGAGGWGVFSARRGASRAMRSRDELVAGFGAVTRQLPAVLGTLVGASATGVAAATVFEVAGLWFLPSFDANEIKLVAMAAVVAGGALFAAATAIAQLRHALASLEPAPRPVFGRVVTQADAPGLWRFVSGLAGVERTAQPDTIVLGLTEGFYVTSAMLRVLPADTRVEGRTLYVPAPYLPLLHQAEMAAIMGHELGHFTGQDTRYSRDFLPLYDGMSRSMAAVEAGQRPLARGGLLMRPAVLLAANTLDRFHAAVRHWSRLRETEADKAGAAAGGARAVATALLRTSLLEPVVDAVLQDAATVPTAGAADLVAQAVERTVVMAPADTAALLEDRQAHPTDSHPTTGARLAALGITPDQALVAEATRPPAEQDAAFAASLFTDWPALRQGLSADLLAAMAEADTRERAALQEAAAGAEAPTELHETVAILLGIRLTLAAVCGSLAAGLLWLLLDNTGSSSDGTPILWTVFAALAVAALALAYTAWRRWTHARTGPAVVLTPAGLRLRGLAADIPWDAVIQTEMQVGRSTVLIVVLHPGSALPAKLPDATWRLRVRQRRHAVSLAGVQYRGWKAQAVLDLLGRYQHAAAARRILAAQAAAP